MLKLADYILFCQDPFPTFFISEPVFVVEAALLVLFITGGGGAFQPLVAEFSSAITKTNLGLGSWPKKG